MQQIRYEHRQHGTYVCGGMAAPRLMDPNHTGFKVCIQFPPTWSSLTMSSTYEEWRHIYDGWTLGLWIDDVFFHRATICDCAGRDMAFQYHSIRITDPRRPGLVSRFLDDDDGDEVEPDDTHGDWYVRMILDLEERNLYFDILTMATVVVCSAGQDVTYPAQAMCDHASAVDLIPHLTPLNHGWNKVRTTLRRRSLVLYWWGLTARQMAPGGTMYARDVAEFGAMMWSAP